jgi:penicillin-binding protein-related factor A (putative recombinase)
MDFSSGREAGATFQALFERQCQLEGVWFINNHTTAKRGWKGRLVELPSNLDYALIRRGRVGYFDCKTFHEPYFVHSDLKPHQVELAARYNENGVPAGFVVWFRPKDEVVFFPGWMVVQRGPGSRFEPQHGTHLGRWHRFDVACLLDTVT